MAQLLLINPSSVSFYEDDLATVQVVLATAPAFDVTYLVSLPEGLCWEDESVEPREYTFTTENWFTPQSFDVFAIDDLLIEPDTNYTVSITSASSDPVFDGLSETLSVVIVDNDFQLTLEPYKRPSGGNNHIIYDAAGGITNLGPGNDWVEIDPAVLGTANNYLFIGGAGDDIIEGAVQARGDDGNDTITLANSSTRFLYNSSRLSTPFVIAAGGTGNDSLLSTSTSAAYLAGGEGDDTITSGSGDDVLYGDGYNSIRLVQTTTSSNSSPAQFFETAVSGSASGADIILGGGGNDLIYGGGGNDTLYGDDGADLIYGGSGDDLIYGGAGNDTLDGGTGNDIIYAGVDNDDVSGGDGNDTIYVGVGDDTVSGGAGDDRIYLETGNDAAWGDSGADTITGGEGDDELHGGTGNDTLSGDEGSDVLYGDEGDDTLSGGVGDDVLDGGADQDVLSGGIGSDRLYGGTGNDTLYGGGDADVLSGDEGADTLFGDDGNDTLSGGADDDVLDAGADNDALDGGTGNDVLDAGDGDDRLIGGTGDDVLDGGAGNDILTGGTGADILTGGDGSDTFVFDFTALDDATDLVTDFEVGAGGDTLDVASIHAQNIANGTATWPAAELPFSHGYFRFVQNGDNTVVGYDRDGNGSEYFFEPIVTLLNVDATSLTAENFNLGQDNFGLTRTGFVVEQQYIDNTQTLLNINLWGGQPTTDVTVIVSLLNGTQIGFATFTPTDWQGFKTIDLGAMSADFYVGTDLSYRIESTDPDYTTGELAAVVIDETFVYEKPRLFAPELSIVDAVNNSINLSTNLADLNVPAGTVKLISTLDPDLIVEGTVTVENGAATIVLDDGGLSGSHEFVGYADLNGEFITFPIAVEFDNPNAAVANISSEQVVEGAQTSLAVTLTLDHPAGGDISVAWAVGAGDANSALPEDFGLGTYPTGQVNFSVGEQTQTILIPITDDANVEPTETFDITFDIVSGYQVTAPAPVTISIRDNDTPAQTGGVYYVNGAPMDLGFEMLRSEIDLTGDGGSTFSQVAFDEANGVLTLTVSADATSLENNFEFFFATSDGVVASITQSSSLSGWSVLSNQTDSGFAVAGISLSAISEPGAVELFSIEFSGVTLETMPTLLEGLVGNTSLAPVDVYQTLSINVENGAWSTNAGDGAYSVSVGSIFAPNAETWIDSRDALMALQIATGSIGVDDLDNALQISAADIDGNGSVSTLDAWYLLRHVVGYDAPNIGDVFLVDASFDLSQISAANSQPDLVDQIVINSAQTSAQWAYVVGDVNGDYLL